MKNKLFLLFFFAITFKIVAFTDPYYLKSVAFTQGNESLIPIFRLNESFQFSFDDLTGSETDYYYQVQHCNRDWKPSNLSVNEYLTGMQNIRIASNGISFNTFQAFINYKLTLPNRDTKIKISGNYLLQVYNQSNELVLERRFIVYEDLVTVGVEIKKTRNLSVSATKQNVYLNIDFGQMLLQNPKKNVNVVILQNGQWHNSIANIEPQYIIGAKFTYQYDNETNFWGGNEFLFFDNSDIKQINNNIEKITRDDLFQVFLRTKYPLKNSNFYSFYQDVNGAFKPRNALRDNNTLEADYTWVYFDYKLEKLNNNQKLYIVGMFNDYQISNDSELKFNDTTQSYQTALLLKQGFTNYKYVVADNNGIILEELNPDGNYFETENIYHTLVYYKTDTDRYERIIGMGKADSKLITN